MKIVVAQIKQETNSFSPVLCGRETFAATYLFEGEEGMRILKNSKAEISGIYEVLTQEDVNIIPSIMTRSQSGGPVDRTFCDWFTDQLTKTIRENSPIDGVFLSMHGAMQLTDEDDGTGLILEIVRKTVGDGVVISISTDYHANITKKMIENTDIICGFHTYPHIDFFETGYRAAKLGMMCIKDRKKLYMAHIKLPMLHPAEACLTNEQPLKGLNDYASQLEKSGEILDYSIYQMQPWLDVKEGGACVLVISDCKEKASKNAYNIAKMYFDIREQLVYDLYPLDEVIDMAISNTTNKPVVLADSADSPSAGATADSTAVLSRLLERKVDIKTALVVADPKVPLEAQQVGIGNIGEFTLGGKMDPSRHKPITVKAYVKSLSDGRIVAQGTAYNNTMVSLGHTAVLQVGNIDIVVCQKLNMNYDPQVYRSVGIEPKIYKLVQVKSSLQYRQSYGEFTDLMYTADTPGSSSSKLSQYDYKRIPRPIYPFENIKGFNLSNVDVY